MKGRVTVQALCCYLLRRTAEVSYDHNSIVQIHDPLPFIHPCAMATLADAFVECVGATPSATPRFAPPVDGKTECSNCGATHTPLWRRGLNNELNYNACGLYCKLVCALFRSRVLKLH